MVSSMTAYSRCEKIEENIKIFIEIRAYNSRYLDISLKMSSELAEFEESIKKIIGSYIFRGRLEIKIHVEDFGDKEAEIYIDEEKAKSYYEMYSSLVNKLGLKDDGLLEQILRSEGVIVRKELKDRKKYFPFLKKVLEETLKDLVHMKNEEGRAIYEDLSTRIDFIKKLADRIEEESIGLSKAYKNKLELRIADLVDSEGVEIDQSRLAQEVAYIADKSDICEEIVRMKSHLSQFSKYLESDKPCGRKLNFLLQELHREINTAGVKAGDFQISKDCVEIKSELEKIREQVQNIE